MADCRTATLHTGTLANYGDVHDGIEYGPWSQRLGIYLVGF